MSLPLFRPEAIEAQTSQWLGGIRIARNPRFTAVASAAVCLAAALLAFGIWGQTTRKARVAGVLMPEQGLLHLSAPQSARLIRLLVKEGDKVQAGQLLAILHAGQATTQGDIATLVARSQAERLATLEAERQLARSQSQQRHVALSDRLRSLQTELVQAEGELDASRSRLQLSAKSVERYRQLSVEGFVADAQLQAKQEDWLDQQVRERNAQRTLEGLRREMRSLQAEVSLLTTSLETQYTQLDRAKASLAQESTESTARAELTLTAPLAGMVGAVPSTLGQPMQAGQTILSLVPSDLSTPAKLQAELYAPSRTAGFIQPGQRARLRVAAFPYQKFGMAEGVVRSVSRTPVNPQDLPVGQGNLLLNAAQTNEPLYRVTLSLQKQHIAAYGQAHLLKVGMTIDADVIQDQRALWEWVLEPLLAARARSLTSSQDTTLSGGQDGNDGY